MKEFPPFRLDTANQCLWRTDAGIEERIRITPKAFAVLRYLVEHAGRLITQDELLNALWPDTFVQPEVLKTHILDVRSALGDSAKNPRFIETLPKRGYQFIAPVRDAFTPKELTVELHSRKLVGRNTQLGELRNCLLATLASQHQVVFITGEPGIGKTSLVDEFMQRAAIDFPAICIARGQCVEGFGGTEAYYPILEILSQLCSASGGDTVVQTLSTQAPTWLVQFPALIKSEQREMLQREILGATRERMLREICEALETIASENPLLLVLEDMHWVDRSTVDLISAVARRRAPGKLMLIGTYRPVDVTLAQHPLKGVKQDLLVHHLCREIALEPLRETEVAEYLAIESAGKAAAEGLARLIYRHTEGNPLFMVAALDHMRDRGLIAIENGAWQVKVPLEQIGLEAPESLRQMIELQIERLSFEEQRVLEVASVLRKFPLSVTIGAGVANVEPDAFEEVLEGLARKHRIIRSAGLSNLRNGSSPSYEFVHVLYRQVLYRRIGSARRRKLHQIVAEYGETLSDLRDADVTTELAYQFEEGGNWLRAIKYFLLEADTAGRRFEPKQAATILEHALELVKQIPEAERAQPEIEVLQKLATIYSISFDPRAVETYDALATRAAHYGLADVEVRALLDMSLPLANFGAADQYIRAVERAGDALSQVSKGDTQKWTWLRALYLNRRLCAGKWDAGEMKECRNLVAKLRETRDRRLLGEVQQGFGYTLLFSSEYREANRSAEEGFAILLKGYEENPYLSFHFQVNEHLVTSCLLFLGEWGHALRRIEQRVRLVEKNGDSQTTTIATLGRSRVYIHAMDFAGAQQILESSRLVVTPVPTLDRFWLIWAGAAEAGLGHYERALEYLLKCREKMDQHPTITDWYNRMPLQWTLTEVWLSKGDLEKARVEAEQFLRVTLASEERTFRALAFEANARIAIAEQKFARAQDLTTKALEAMDGFEVPLAHWRVHGTAAELHGRLGNRDLAERHRESSCATIMKLANSLPAEEPLRNTFLSAPLVSKILGDRQAPSLRGRGVV
ncbi:MAG TPA: AAA family ATPase [Candidatus Acidoferrales bacterium]|nr:AAA family ATPase [Candidatus Acidoferrales bacterium]